MEYSGNASCNLDRRRSSEGRARTASPGITRTSVCVVGAGPAGLLLALLLAKRGADVIVLEGHQTFDREFRGEVLQPSALRLLDHLGLLDDILSRPHAKLTEAVYRIAGRVSGRFEWRRIVPEYPYAVWMPQPSLLSMLRDKAQQFPGFQCWMGARVDELVERSGKVRGVRGERGEAGRFEVRADVVVGADGRHSLVRRLAGASLEYEHDDFDVVWFLARRPAPWCDTMYFVLGEDVQGVILPRGTGEIQAGLLVPKGEWQSWRRRGLAHVAERVRRLDPVFTEFADGLQDFGAFFPLSGELKLVREWSRDGLLLIGDAAHTMSPTWGVGVNVALATAVAAAQVIFPRLGRGAIAGAHLAPVQASREQDVRVLHRFQRNVQHALIVQPYSNPLVAWLLPKLLPFLLLSPVLPMLQRWLLFETSLPAIDPEFSFREQPFSRG
jgi:2-polyprenyl-6-methoxyphenol hydroxylase-like FAD-dependent oxidoreductase